MSNPYQGTKKRWVHASSGNEAGSGPMPYTTRSGKLAFADSRLSSASGDINASSTKEWADVVSALQKAVGQKEYSKVAPNQNEIAEQKKHLVEAAIGDKDGAAWQALGEVIGDEVFETMGREAFAAKTLLHKPLARGEIGRIRIRKKDVICFFATRQPEVVASQVRQFYVYPPEYYLVGRVLIEDAEIEQASGDLLDDKYQDALEQIQREQDKVWKRLVDAAQTVYNDSFLFNTLNVRAAA